MGDEARRPSITTYTQGNNPTFISQEMGSFELQLGPSTLPHTAYGVLQHLG